MTFPFGFRETNRHLPPTRRSISQTSIVQPVGPYQRFRSSGLVRASKTRLGGASKSRLNITSRSVGVDIVNLLPSINLTPLYLRRVFRQAVHRVSRTRRSRHSPYPTGSYRPGLPRTGKQTDGRFASDHPAGLQTSLCRE